MARKKYRVSTKAAPFVRGGEFKFTVGYDKNYGVGPFDLIVRDLPIVTVPQRGVVTTTNAFTQGALETMIVPQRTERNGQKWPSGLLFEDITGGPQPVDVDLDSILT